MRERVWRALEALTQDPRREAAWLHTLSLLEYIGARKIGRTAAAHHPSTDVLRHWSDETRHAAAFKSLAAELWGGEPTVYLCGDEAKRYFAELDAALARWALERAGENPRITYLLVTTVIERRAMALYPLYRAASRQRRVREGLSRIIVEEQSHRVAIEEQCRVLLARAAEDVFAEPLRIEERLFEQLWSAIENSLWMQAPAATPSPQQYASPPSTGERP
jgi:hypothetical protein